MYNIAIVEDNVNTAEAEKSYLEHYAEQSNVKIKATIYTNGEDFLESNAAYDIVLMDIQLPFLDGLSTAHKLRERDQETIIIFVTGMSKFAIRGYEVNALDYIVKPIIYKDFAFRLERAFQLLKNKESQDMFINIPYGVKHVVLRDLMFVEVVGHKCYFHTTSSTFEVNEPLVSVENKLHGRGFIKCSRKCLINPAHIDGILDNTISIKGTDLIISSTQKKAFFDAFNLWLSTGSTGQ